MSHYHDSFHQLVTILLSLLLNAFFSQLRKAFQEVGHLGCVSCFT
jgi:hypothetical protein